MLNLTQILASFTTPVNIDTNPQSLLWALPLVAVISIVYKASKMKVLFLKKLLKDSTVLFLSIVFFMVAASVALYAFVEFVTG